jgi:transcriptional regulator with XRE-family HTH domain
VRRPLKATPGPLGERLEFLLKHVNRPNNRPYSGLGELAEEVAKRGVQTSRKYLSALKTGARTNPTIELLDAVAEVFGVPVEVFTKDPSPAFDAIKQFVDREGRNIDVDTVRAIVATVAVVDSLPQREQMLFRGWRRASSEVQDAILRLVGDAGSHEPPRPPGQTD